MTAPQARVRGRYAVEVQPIGDAVARSPSAEEIESLRQRVAAVTAEVQSLLVETHLGSAWEALGYDSWDSLARSVLYGNHTLARFLSRVEPQPDGCWLWTGGGRDDGYGSFYDDGTIGSHQWSYRAFVGPTPAGLVLDHLCRNRRCVNPTHLEPVTNQENLRRGINRNTVKTHCAQGHPYDESNTQRVGGTAWRKCATCNRERVARYKARKKAAS